MVNKINVTTMQVGGPPLYGNGLFVDLLRELFFKSWRSHVWYMVTSPFLATWEKLRVSFTLTRVRFS